MASNIFVAPCVNERAHENYRSIVLEGVRPSEIPEAVREQYDLEASRHPIWVTGNETAWDQVEPGDLILFYGETGRVTSLGWVRGTVRDPSWGARLLTNFEDEPREYILILEDLHEVNLDLEAFNRLFDYSSKNRPRGFSRIAPERVDEAIEEHGGFSEFVESITRSRLGTRGDHREDIPLRDVADRFIDYLDTRGFYFHDDEVRNFVTSLKTKPFVILAGISGTGKTKLASLFADFISAERTIISVKPDWTDNTDLLGYQDLSNRFQKQTMTEVLIEANRKENRDRPFFVILDEMNLARVEHYFSDFLSKMETRSRRNGHVESDPIFDSSELQNLENGDELRGLRLPGNLYIVGTVNMDETTHPFSRKVLDRANSLEFNDVALGEVRGTTDHPETVSLSNQVLQPEYVRLPEVYDNDPEFFDGIIERLERLNEILKRGDFQFGYRVRDEVCLYLWHAREHDVMEPDRAFDFQMKQKVLPRLQGSTRTLETILEELHRFTTRRTPLAHPEDWQHVPNIADQLDDFSPDHYDYPRSGKKILRMQRRYLEQTFTSFWI